MVATGPWSPANPLARVWAARLDGLRSWLHRDPSNPYAWHWQIRTRILSFLLARYGDDPSLSLPAQHLADRSAWALPGLGPAYGRPARSGAVIRAVLERIAEANRRTEA
jgi:hypothetical protein